MRHRYWQYPPALMLVALLLLVVSGCRDLSIPPPPSHTADILRSCTSSTIKAYAAGKKTLDADDLASIACQMDQKLDAAAILASPAATVCAHALNAYAPPLPRKIAAATIATGTGTGACVQVQSQCGYAFFFNQTDLKSSTLELLGPAGCTVPPDSTRGVLFACCVKPAAPITPPGGTGPGTTTHTEPN